MPGGKKILRAVKANSTHANLSHLHTGVLHSMRRVSVLMSKNHWNGDACAMAAADVCTQFRVQMGSLLELDEHELHCCWKVLVPGEDHNTPEISTWVRSKPLDDRPDRPGTRLDCLTSTIYASLTGGDDGMTHWRRLPCFSCQDLAKYSGSFKSERPHLTTFYNSSLVFPLRFVRNPDTNDADLIGFIAFDSPKAHAFGDIPEIFKYGSDPADYNRRLHASSAFHLGAIFADSLSAHLHGVYNAATGSQGSIHVAQRSTPTKQPTLEGSHRKNQRGRRAISSGVPLQKPDIGGRTPGQQNAD